MAERDWAEEARRALATAAEPVRLHLAEIQQKLDANEAERKTLVEARREVKAMLDRLTPPSERPTPKKTATKKRTGTAGVTNQEMDERIKVIANREQKRKLVREFLVEHGDRYADGFTAAQVHRDLRAFNGKGEISPGVVLEIVQGFHRDGFVRAVKKVRGGAMQYKLVLA